MCVFRVDEASSLFQGQANDNDSRSFGNTEFCECESSGVNRCSPFPVLNIEIKGKYLENIT